MSSIEPFHIGNENQCHGHDKRSIHLDSLNRFPNDETENEAFTKGMRPQSPLPGLIDLPMEDFVGPEASKEAKKDLRTDCSPPKPPSNLTGAASDKRENQVINLV